MEELTLDSILEEGQIDGLFPEETQDSPPEENGENRAEEAQEDTEEINTTETTPESLFGGSESVGSEEIIEDKEGTTSNKGDNSSDFYSSIANALVEDGILQNLDDKEISSIKTAEDFADLISSQIKNQFDERQRRIDEALTYGVEPTEIQKFERYISILDSVTEEGLTAEDEQGEHLRKNLIYQDYMNKGYSKEKALKMVDRSIKAGTDIEDAREALQDNKDFYRGHYDNLLKEAREAQVNERRRLQEQADALKKSILKEEKAFGEITLDNATRQKVYDSICKPVYTDPDTGEKYTAIQKYELENRTEFLKNVGLLFTLTNGFKDINKLVNDKVKKETKKSLRNLEHVLKGSGNNLNKGNLSFANNSGDNDPESYFKGWKLSV